MRRLSLLAIVLTIGVPASLLADLYVANSNAASVTIYSPFVTAGGISRSITGAATNLVTPSSVTVDAVHNELYVADFRGEQVLVYSLNASGNAAPIRTLINGPNSGLSQVRKVVIDTTHDEMIVLNIADSIRTYPRTASGDAAPTRVISGASTLLSNPIALQFDAANDELIASTFDTGGTNSGIVVFPRVANGNVAPLRVISGTNTLIGTNAAPMVAYDSVAQEYVARLNEASKTPSAILVFPRTANGNVAPSRVISGTNTGLMGLGSIAVDEASGRYMTAGYVTSNTVRFFPRSAFGNVAPLFTLSGAGTGLNGPLGIDVDSTGGPVGGAQPGDFNADIKSDLLWRKSTTGENAMWLMNGTAIGASALLPTVSDTNWKIAGTGDFDGDGKADVLWWHALTGKVVIWLMNGSSLLGSGTVATVSDVNWHIAGAGDFDGDGRSDIVWRNSATGQIEVWLMNGVTMTGSGSPGTVADPNWIIAGVGDFDGDRRSDLFWRNTATGQDVLWIMNGTALGPVYVTNTVANLDYRVAGIGDANLDGKSDVFWWNQSTGDVAIWLMDGPAIVSGATIPTSSTNWHIEGVGDFDADGRADLMWRNVTNGQVVVWLMNGTAIRTGAFLTTVSDLNWSIAAPR